MADHTFRQLCRYRFDRFMSRGGSSIFLSLLIVTLGSFLLIGVLRWVTMLIWPHGTSPETDESYMGQLYTIWLALTDPGNMNQDKFASPVYKITAVMAGMAGIVIFSMLIGFITTALDQKIGDLKKGRSKVIESGHTLILGWGDRVPEIIRELVIANESEDRPRIVILAENDKEEMDDYLALHMPDTQNTQVITRSGKVSSLINLDVVSVKTCKSVIILPWCTDAESQAEKDASDTRVIKTVLGLVASKHEGQELNIVAELFNTRSRKIATDITDEVTCVDGLDILAKILVQTSRSIGLSVVYNEVMSFDGVEMYLWGGEDAVDWGGITYGKVQFHFPDGIPIGLRRADGSLLINPALDTVLNPGDDVIIIAEDDSTIAFEETPVAEPTEHDLAGGANTQRIERELIIGWNAKAPIIIEQYADYVLEGSVVDVLMPDPPDEVREKIAQLQEEQPALKLSLIDADPLKPEALLALEPFQYDNIILLSQGGVEIDPETVDSETIIILLQLRRIFDDHPEQASNTKLISEVMDSDNMELVSRAGVNDFIVSNRLVSMLLAQVSEEPAINDVYADLFEEDGSEIYLKPASLYFKELPGEYTYADMMRIAQKRGECCIGVKIAQHEQDMSKNFGVKLIPEKNTRYTLGPDDRLIVVAEDET
ncbi:hypothetical protein OT109_13385 [Phycisphaeraceae bacterium D3-23]